MNGINKLLRKIFNRVLWLFPFKQPSVLFTSFEGQYNDNPKAIATCLHELDPSINLFWATSEKGKDSLPDYLIPVEYKSKEYDICSYRCQVLIDNVIGYRWKGIIKGRKFPRQLLSSEKQLNISTWHGTPIKKIGRHAGNLTKYNSFISSCDYLIAGCEYTKNRLSDAFQGIPVRLTGTPRNDVLLKKFSDREKNDIKNALGIPRNAKVILYAPTFRETIEDSGLRQLNQISFKELFHSLEERFGGNWVFVFRVHHSVLMKIDIEELKLQSKNRIINGNIHDDMADYLSITDVLLTDYSGSAFDFALTERPCFLFTPDIEKYKEDRGTYIEIEKLPYKSAKTEYELYDIIQKYDEKEAKQRRALFNQWNGNAENGHASETIVNAIIEFLKTGKKENLL